MESDQKNHSKLLGGLLVGSVLGAAAGFMLAPKSGKELRSDIKGRTKRAVDETKRLYSDGRTRFEDVLDGIGGRRRGASFRRIEPPEDLMVEA